MFKENRLIFKEGIPMRPEADPLSADFDLAGALGPKPAPEAKERPVEKPIGPEKAQNWVTSQLNGLQWASNNIVESLGEYSKDEWTARFEQKVVDVNLALAALRVDGAKMFELRFDTKDGNMSAEAVSLLNDSGMKALSAKTEKELAQYEPGVEDAIMELSDFSTSLQLAMTSGDKDSVVRGPER